MKDQVEEDLSLFGSNDFRSEYLKECFSKSKPKNRLVFYQIKNNTVYWTRNWEGPDSFDRVRKSTQMLNRMTKTRKLPDVEFILTVHDGWGCLDENPSFFDEEEELISEEEALFYPIFGYAKKEGSAALLFPDPLTEAFSRRSGKSIRRANFKWKYRWGKKENVAFWRGGTTGNRKYSSKSWYLNPRSKLSMLSKYYPDLVNSGFTSYPGVEPEVQHKITQILPQVEWVNHKNHLKYKYLVVPDGNTCTYPRYYLGLLSNSVVFKQKSNQVQWYYKGLQPFVHYIPVAYDFSDLPELVLWARNHDAELKKISRHALSFVNRNLKSKQIYDYVEWLLKEYAKKQQSTSIELLEGAQTYEACKRSNS